MDEKAIAVESLEAFLASNPRIVVLTGAGISVASGIPTYRDREGIWRHSKPVQHQEFMTQPGRRQRYWARSMRGWPAVRDAQPTRAHSALANLEHCGQIDTVITQNVDRLHQRSGSKRVVDLHGRLDRVRCLDCEAMHCRDLIQKQLSLDNASFEEASATRPDGDADLPPELEVNFRVPDCNACGGTLMPDVVFFGGSVPKSRVETCIEAITRADALLSIGSSLQVFSGFRFCRLANELGKPVAIINPGKTRADEIAQLKIQVDCQKLLHTIATNSDC
ncbi:MAG: NAD-dependent protein deacetylase [Halioglobus sp.]